MAKKIGRPTDNPKNVRITVRLDEKSVDILERYCIQEEIDKGEATRRAIKNLEDDLKK
ncbi:MAG: ribbon-helix-helix protein, CopG family [Sedimentibacter sp.]|uniref:ribbon-helix-helix protein, CopG family n=1 Tax=Sedimentibacter sp. TaxID=1960295 RepID=UPI002980D657|nr:ribbon-helix-helix protein, CopG family [Sedimentibacter sp.]MDW5298852.1 ribbon-helix-helix protein, CopG family [Sedimentibacter sp.]